METKGTNLGSWVASHPYLEPLAELHTQMDAALREVPEENDTLPNWEAYLHDFHAGIPLLQSSEVTIDPMPAAKTLSALLDRLALTSKEMTDGCRTLQTELNREPHAPRNAIAALLNGGEVRSKSQGLLQFLGWTALSRYLRPLVSAFAQWRDEDKWLRNYCPTCGANASMAQLLERENGRRRLLCCGRCETRWQYRRTGCPFCETQDDHCLRALSIEGEGGVRIDYCVHCRGYLKTYDGEGNERILLANWTSIHLDILARDRSLSPFAELPYVL